MESSISVKEPTFGISKFKILIMIIHKTTTKCVVCLHFEWQTRPSILNVELEGLAIEG